MYRVVFHLGNRGIPEIDNTETQIYIYTIETDANTNDCDEASVSGTITIYPEEQLIHDDAQGALSQEVCLGEQHRYDHWRQPRTQMN